MNVRELRKALKKLDPEAVVTVRGDPEIDWNYGDAYAVAEQVEVSEIQNNGSKVFLL